MTSKLVNEPVEAAEENQLSKTIARYGRVDLLCIDELGDMDLERRGAEPLLQVLLDRLTFAGKIIETAGTTSH